MCGIIGFFGCENAFSEAVQGLRQMKNRGLDAFGATNGKEVIITHSLEELGKQKLKSKNIMAHNLHSLVGFIPQPLKGKNSVLVANCELYNWEELNAKHKFNAENDADLLLKMLEKHGLEKTLQEIRGVYAFAWWKENKLVLCRDLLGIKPLWVAKKEGSFAFASERKALGKHFSRIEELNPRVILILDTNTLEEERKQRKFFDTQPLVKGAEKEITERLEKLIRKSVSMRVPGKNVRVGLFFSAGVDSLVIAKALEDEGVKFTCYVAGFPESIDVKEAENAVKTIGLNLKVISLDAGKVRRLVKIVTPLIEDNNPVKVGVGVTLYAAAEEMKKDGVRVAFTGSGADELFAGYERHKHSHYLEKECLSSIRRVYEVNNYRDDVVSMNNNIELRVPFLDLELVDYALRIPAGLKIRRGKSKYVLRRTAERMGVPKNLAFRKKKAAQYGSGVDKAIGKLAKAKMMTKSEYLKQYYNKGNVKLAALVSGGKDGYYALETMMKQNYSIACLVTLKSKNPESFMFHTPNIHLVGLQARAMKLPLIMQETKGIKEEELEDLKKALRTAREEYGVEGVVSGALYSNYQRNRIERVCDELGLKVFAPLWHADQEREMRYVVKNYEVWFSSIAAMGLDKSWLGRRITIEDVDKLVELSREHGINVAGEGGEFETLVLDAPFFEKRIRITDYDVIKENQYTARMLVKKAVLEKKE